MKTIDEAAGRSGRDPGGVRLLAATKSQDVAKIRAAIDAGVHLFGENYVQEAKAKQSKIPDPVEWHMIGHLQRNKAREALRLFTVIESLDSIALARILHQEAERQEQTIRAFVEVNLAGEETKSGIGENEIVHFLEEVERLPHLRVEGLMTIPPYREKLEEIRSYFRRLRRLQEELRELEFPNIDLHELSMGMTHDYPVAVEEGATIVRVGTAIFGPRKE